MTSRDVGRIVEKEDGFYRLSWILKYYRVYNIANVKDKEGNTLEPRLGKTIIEDHVQADQLIANYMKGSGVKLEHNGGGSAYYTEHDDGVHLPMTTSFHSTEAYYRVLFHEMIHSTGIAKRLNRECFKKYSSGKKERSREELIAETGSLLLASECGFRDEHLDDNSDIYITSWCSWMKDNPQEVLSGMLSAEKAKDLIMNGGVLPTSVGDDDLSETKITSA